MLDYLLSKLIERHPHITGEHLINGRLIKIQSELITFHCPFGMAVWHHPKTVLLGEGEHQKQIPIIDTTRPIQQGLLAFSTAFMLGSLIVSIYSRRKYYGKSN